MQAWFGDRTIWALEMALTGVSRRHEAILNNLANIETPGYQRQDVVFRDALRRALNKTARLQPWRTDERHLPVPVRPGDVGTALQPRRVAGGGAAFRADGNTVSPDQEMALLATNALEYQTLTRLAADRLAAIRTAIHEGRR